MVYIPFSARRDPELATKLLQPEWGVPDYAKADLLRWCVVASVGNTGFDDGPSIVLLRNMGLDLKIEWASELSRQSMHTLNVSEISFHRVQEQWRALDDSALLDVVNYLLENPQHLGLAKAEHLRDMLTRIGSGYDVFITNHEEETAELTLRAEPTASAAVEDVVTSGVPGADMLAEAWSALHGRNPDFSQAHDKAIKAVEGALWEIVTPRNPKARIGIIASTLFAQGEKWTMGFDAHFVRQLGPGQELQPGNQPTTSQGMVLGVMVQQLLSGQVDHHNTGPNAGAKITQEAATAAVALATAILQMTRAGTISRGEQEQF